MFDFRDSASRATWLGGTRAFTNPDVTTVRFNTDYGESGGNGYVQLSEEVNNETEDGSRRRYLHAHPPTGRGTMILGLFDAYRVQPFDRFTADLGFIDGATGTDGVTFRFGYIPEGRSVDTDDFFSSIGTSRTRLQANFVELIRATKLYTGSLDSVDVDLNFLAGERVQFVLIVESGRGSGRDWAAWVEPKISAMRRITVQNLFCTEESTSGWSSNRRRVRRHRFSDEVAFMVMMRGVDEAENFTDFAVTELRTRTGVNSGDSVAFEPVDATFVSADTARVLLWVKALEIDGAGSTQKLAQEAFNDWVGHIFFHPNRFTGFDSAHHSFTDVGNGGHDVLFEDYWAVDVDRMEVGGVPALQFDYAGRNNGGPSNVESYLASRSIARSIGQNHFAGMTVETRNYQARNQYSNYSFDVVYR